MKPSPRSFNPIPSLFLASDPDRLKEFNENLSSIIMRKMDEAYNLLAGGLFKNI